jgi:hypothetical protein
MALILLLLPIREPALQQAAMRTSRAPHGPHGPRFSADGVIEGEFRRER